MLMQQSHSCLERYCDWTLARLVLVGPFTRGWQGRWVEDRFTTYTAIRSRREV